MSTRCGNYSGRQLVEAPVNEDVGVFTTDIVVGGEGCFLVSAQDRIRPAGSTGEI